MAQISKKKLDRDIEKMLFDQLWTFMIKAKSTNRAKIVYGDLLTETEKLILAKRLAIALLLIRGKNTIQIRERVHVSYSTITTISAWLKNVKPETYKILNGMSKSKDWEQILDKLEELIDKLQPNPYTNWSRVGKEKFQRKVNRSNRSILQ